MPTPNSDESEQDFVSRCIPIVMHENPKMDNKQASAICYSKFREESMHPDFERILDKFLKRFGKEGTNRFVNFVKKNSLNILKAYNPMSQFTESFEWIEPLIKPYKQDTEAKYYLVTALTADISMNNTDYGPEDRLAREDSSMNWRPVNVNHDHSKWLPYPRTRVDFSAVSDFSLEATLRVDNQDAWLQRKLDAGEILHPSIEGRPHPIKGRYHFTGLALLEKGEELPGDPLTEIVPLVFNESVGESLCEFKDGKMVCECSTTKEVKNSLKEQVKEALKEEAPPDDSTRCPPDMHWDLTVKQCVKGGGASGAGYQTSVSPEEPQCPEGYHYDATIKKCVEGGGQSAAGREQVNENKDRLEVATARVEVLHANEEVKRTKIEIEQLKLKDAESLKLVEEQIKTISKLEGVVSEQEKNLTKKDTQISKSVEEKIEDEKTIHNWQRKCEEALESRDSEKTQKEDIRVKYEKVVTDNQKILGENVQLTSDLTEARNHEVQWNKEKKDLQEGLTKALKHQKYVYEFLKSKGFELVGT